MSSAPSTFLAGAWSDPETESNADAVRKMTETAGWPIFLEAVELLARQVQKDLMLRPVRESTAEYAAELGRVRGLNQIASVIESIEDAGSKAIARQR